MAEAHLEMDDGSTLPLIRICHTADGDRALHAGSYRLQRGADLSDQSPRCLRACQRPGEMGNRGAGPLTRWKMAKERWLYEAACTRLRAMVINGADITCTSRFQARNVLKTSKYICFYRITFSIFNVSGLCSVFANHHLVVMSCSNWT
ncbi:unnamed protein product [Tetraodon nigroviridis]|uniref:(spotted green pufferfish) hypothetical protein n=1 Tax=Tetraodon nigroviridis TaxID=99883 RepID=Q4RE61_TETNG|nr:unnamed protein product [Tetraodon nigroviridis]